MTTSKAELDWNTLEFKTRVIFSPAAPIDNAQLFAGRKLQIRRLLEAISERGRHAILYGERGVGKTSLTNIFHMLIGGQEIGRVRIQSSPQDDFSSLWAKVFRDIQFSNVEDQGYGKEKTIVHSLADKYKGETPRGKPRGINLVQAALAPCLPVPVFECTAEERQRGRYIHGASPVVLCAV